MSTEPITKLINLTEPVEKAARLLYSNDHPGKQWDDLHPTQQHYYRELVLPIVTAAAPSIARQAWPIGYDRGITEADGIYASPNPFREVSPS